MRHFYAQALSNKLNIYIIEFEISLEIELRETHFLWIILIGI